MKYRFYPLCVFTALFIRIILIRNRFLLRKEFFPLHALKIHKALKNNVYYYFIRCATLFSQAEYS